jgi:hypothetical protein
MESQYQNNMNTFTTGAGPVERPVDRDSWKFMLQRFYTDVSALFAKEGQLIRTEMSEKATQVKTGVISFAAAGVVLFIGALCFAATAMILLALIIPIWLSAVVVTAAFLVIGAVMLAAAKKKMDADNLVPRKSIDALSDIRYSLKEKVNEITKH